MKYRTASKRCAPCSGCLAGHPVFTRDPERTGSIEALPEMTLGAR